MRKAKEIIINHIVSGDLGLHDISEIWRKDKDVVLAAFKSTNSMSPYGWAFSEVLENFKNDKELILAAMQHFPSSTVNILDNISPNLKDDREVVRVAVSLNGHALWRASKRLHDDEEIALIALGHSGCGTLLECLSERLRDNKAIVILAVSSSKGDVVQFASDRLKNDLDVATMVVGKGGDSFKYLNPDILNDEKVKHLLIDSFTVRFDGWSVAPSYVQEVKSIALRAIQNEANNLEYASEGLRDDPEVLLAAFRSERNMDSYWGESISVLRFASKRLRGDREIVQRAIKSGPVGLRSALQFASPQLKDDEEMVFSAIKEKGAANLAFASSRLRDKLSVVHAALDQTAKYAPPGEVVLQYASKRLRSNRKLVIRAMELNVTALEHAGLDLHSDKELKEMWIKGIPKLGPFDNYRHNGLHTIPAGLIDDSKSVIAAVRRNGNLLKFASEKLRDNERVVLAALGKSQTAIQYSSIRLRNSKKIALAATHEDASNLVYVSERLRKNIDVLVNAIEDINHYKWNGRKDRNESSGKAKDSTIELVKKMADSYEFIIQAVRKNGMLLEFASEDMRSDRRVVLAAVINCPRAYQFAEQNLKADKIISEVRMRDGLDAPKYFSRELLDEKEMVYVLVKRISRNLEFVSARWQDDKDLVLTAMKEKGNRAIEYTSERLRDDFDVAAAAVSAWWHNLQYVSNRLKDNIEIVRLAMDDSVDALKFAGDKARNNRELNIYACKKFDYYHLKYAGESLVADEELVKLAISRNIFSLDYATVELQQSAEFRDYVKQEYLKRDDWNSIPKCISDDRDVVLKAVSNSYMTLEAASNRLKNDLNVVLAAVRKDGWAFEFASEHLKNNKRVLMTALSTRSDAYKYASERLQNDYNVKGAYWDIKQEERAEAEDEYRKDEYYRSLYEDSDNCPACQSSPCMCSDPF